MLPATLKRGPSIRVGLRFHAVGEIPPAVFGTDARRYQYPRSMQLPMKAMERVRPDWK